MLASQTRSAPYSLGLALIALAGTSGGLGTIAGKYATLAGVDAMTITLARFSVGAVALWLALPLFGLRMRVPSGLALRLVLLGAGPGIAMSYLNIASLRYLPAGPAALLFYTFPSFVLIGAALLGREALTRARLLALAMALVGCALVVGGIAGDALDPRGVALALTAALAAATHVLCSERLLRGVDSLVAVAHMQAGALAAAAAVSVLVGADLTPSAQGVVPVAGVAICATVIGPVLFACGLRRVGASVAAVGAMMETLVTVALGIVLFDESLGPGRLLGAALVLGGMFLMQREGRRVAPAPRLDAGRELAELA